MHFSRRPSTVSVPAVVSDPSVALMDSRTRSLSSRSAVLGHDDESPHTVHVRMTSFELFDGVEATF